MGEGDLEFLGVDKLDNFLIKVLAVVIAVTAIYTGCTIIDIIRKKMVKIFGFSRFSDEIYNRILSCKLTSIIKEHIQFNDEAK